MEKLKKDVLYGTDVWIHLFKSELLLQLTDDVIR